MGEIYTTLNAIRDNDPCESGWKKLLKFIGKANADDEPIKLTTILESNGIHDAIWALRSVDGFDREKRLFACACARIVLPIFEKTYPNDTRPRKAIEVAEKYAEGLATKEELDAAAYAAYAAAYDAARAAYDAADAAYDAADAAAYAAYAAAYAAYDAADAAYDAYDAADAAWAAAWEIITKEFIDLCQHQSEYKRL